MQVLYAGLADGRPVGQAFTRAKNAITRLTARGKRTAPVIHAHPGTRLQCLTGSMSHRTTGDAGGPAS